MTPQEKRAHEYAKKASLCPGEFDARFESYLQAEKDLALTWEDIKKIDGLSMEVTTLFASVGRNKDILERPFYEEIARRFNEQRKK